MAEKSLAVGLNMRDRFTSGLNKASKGIDRFTSRGIARFKSLALGATGLSTALAAVTSALSARAFTGFIGKVVDLDTKMLRFSERTGVSVETLSALKFAGEQNSIEFEQLAFLIEKLQRKMGDLRLRGVAELKDSFDALGGGVTDAIMAGRSVEEVFPLVGDAFKNLRDPVLKSSIALKIFEEAGGKALPVLLEGSDGLRRYREEAARYGLLVTRAAIEPTVEFGEELSKLKTIFFQLGAQGIRAAMPELQKFVDDMKQFAEKDGQAITSAFESVAESIVDLTRAMLTVMITIEEARLGLAKLEKMSKESVLGALIKRGMTPSGTLQNAKDLVSLAVDSVTRKFPHLPPAVSKPGQKLPPKNKAQELADSLVASPEELQAIDLRMAELRLRIDDLKKLRDGTGKVFGPDLPLGFKHPEAPQPPPQPEGPTPEEMKLIGIRPGEIDKLGRIATDQFDQVRTSAMGVRDALNQLADRTPYETMRQGMSLVGNTIEDSLATGLADLSTGVMRTKEDFADFARSTVRALTQILFRMIAIKTISAGLSLFGFGSTGAEGAAQLGAKSAVPDFSGSIGSLFSGVSASHGGIVSGPRSGFPAVLHGAEAVIPLPSRGASIPVEMRGGGQPVSVVVNVQAIDSKSFDDRFFETFQKRLTPIAENLAQEVNSRNLLHRGKA